MEENPKLIAFKDWLAGDNEQTLSSFFQQMKITITDKDKKEFMKYVLSHTQLNSFNNDSAEDPERKKAKQFIKNNSNILLSKNESGNYNFVKDFAFLGTSISYKDLKGRLNDSDNFSALLDILPKDFIEQVTENTLTGPYYKPEVFKELISKVTNEEAKNSYLEKINAMETKNASDLEIKNNFVFSALSNIALTDKTSHEVEKMISSLSTEKLQIFLENNINGEIKNTDIKTLSKVIEIYNNKGTEEVTDKAKQDLLTYAINQDKPEIVCEMAKHGFKLDAKTVNSQYNGIIGLHASDLKKNKSIFTQMIGKADITDNDALRIMVASSVRTNDTGAHRDILNKYKGASPLMIAIETDQKELAMKLIAAGQYLKHSELTLGTRMKAAVGLVDVKKLSKDLVHKEDSNTKTISVPSNVKVKNTKLGRG